MSHGIVIDGRCSWTIDTTILTWILQLIGPYVSSLTILGGSRAMLLLFPLTASVGLHERHRGMLTAG